MLLSLPDESGLAEDFAAWVLGSSLGLLPESWGV